MRKTATERKNATPFEKWIVEQINKEVNRHDTLKDLQDKNRSGSKLTTLHQALSKYKTSHPDWIPIAHSLPPKDTNVLATNFADDWITICFIKTKRWYNSFDIGDANACEVYPTHWMALPKHPKEWRKDVGEI